MNDQDKTKPQLIEELAKLRQCLERRLTTLISNLPGMAYRCKNDPDWTMEFISDGCVPLTGYAPSAFLGNSKVAYGEIIHPDDRRQAWETVQQAIAEGRHFQMEYRILTASGEMKWVWEQGVGIYSDGGQLEALEGLVMDITQRKQAEAALQNARDELEKRVEERTADLLQANRELEIHRLFAQTATQGFGIADLDGRIKYLNPAMCRMLGEERIEDVLGQTFFKYGRTSEFLKDEFLPTLFGDGRWDREGVLRTSQGKMMPIYHSSFIIRDTVGQPAYIATILTDITECKQAEEALQKSEERFRSYFEQGLMGMALSNRDMQWTEVNDRFCEILGYSREEALQQKITNFVHPDDLAAFHRSYQKLLTGEIDHYTAERRLIGKAGKAIYLNIFVKGFRSPDGKVDHVFALFEDVTERVNAQTALRQSHDELQAIYEGMVDGLLIADVETKMFIRANTAICGMLGYTRDELLAKSVMDIHPASELPAVLRVFEAQAAGQVIVNENAPVLRKDGSVFYADIATNRIRYDDRPCLVGFFRDATERRAAQESLKREHRTLKHLLQSSDHERQTIAYEIHDGLAQYLAAAIMQFDVFAHLLKMNPEDAMKAYEGAITLIRRSHSESRRLIAGVRPPVLDEEGVVEAVAHLINDHNREKGPRVEFHSMVAFDRLQPLLENAIYRIIQEGITNACKYSQSSRVRVTLLQKNDRIRLEIRDWGMGFDPREVKEGSYGLTGIRERARLLGGKHKIQSAAGKGTRIAVELPLVEKED